MEAFRQCMKFEYRLSLSSCIAKVASVLVEA